MTIRLVVFDCDGTLVDSQHVITASMGRTCAIEGLEPPPVAAVRRIVGLSLVQAMAVLFPDQSPARCEGLATTYKEAFAAIRAEGGFVEPLFDGAVEVLAALEQSGHLLAMATGKSDRGVEAVLAHHGLDGNFTSIQTADGHPSKPHPSMLEAAMAETGSAPGETAMVGDTTFDVEMARAAGVWPIGVGWGYHDPDELRTAGAATILRHFRELPEVLARPGP